MNKEKIHTLRKELAEILVSRMFGVVMSNDGERVTEIKKEIKELEK